MWQSYHKLSMCRRHNYTLLTSETTGLLLFGKELIYTSWPDITNISHVPYHLNDNNNNNNTTFNSNNDNIITHNYNHYHNQNNDNYNIIKIIKYTCNDFM